VGLTRPFAGDGSVTVCGESRTTMRDLAVSRRKGGDSNPRDGGCPSNGFQDRRIQPLCHPSAARSDPTRSHGSPGQGLNWPFVSQGEVAEWLKALAC
jgi:hypothetical protein